MNHAHGKYPVDNCRIVRLPYTQGDYGVLTVAEEGLIPFGIERVYYIYDIPTDSERGGHSHYREHRIVAAVTGCFDVMVDDGRRRKVFTLRTPYDALYIPPGIWRTLYGFSAGSVALALCSNKYSADDYVREYDEFKKLVSNGLT